MAALGKLRTLPYSSVLFCFILRQNLTVQPWLVWNFCVDQADFKCTETHLSLCLSSAGNEVVDHAGLVQLFKIEDRAQDLTFFNKSFSLLSLPLLTLLCKQKFLPAVLKLVCLLERFYF